MNAFLFYMLSGTKTANLVIILIRVRLHIFMISSTVQWYEPVIKQEGKGGLLCLLNEVKLNIYAHYNFLGQK